MNQPISTRIIVQGRIRIGQELDLVQSEERSSSEESFLQVGLPDDGLIQEIDYFPLSRPGELMQRLNYSLKPKNNDIYIAGDGLVTSYGIFGSPGSGKTYLLLYLLKQILDLHSDDNERKYGALILDPKAALIDDIRALVHAVGRDDDLVVLNTYELNRQNKKTVNVIDCQLDPYELAKILVLAAQSAGVSVSDPFWFLSWETLLGPSLFLLNLFDADVITLRRLLNAVLFVRDSQGQREIQIIAKYYENNPNELPPDQKEDAISAINQINSFFQQDYVATIEAIMKKAYGQFQESRFSCFSPQDTRAARSTTFYDDIIENGKIVLVSLGPSDPGMAKTLCTLVKCIFQQTVLSRLDRVRSRTLQNFKRPLLLACDEYSAIASEVPGFPMGDGDFFSRARQPGCMGLLATQSVNVLQATSLKEHWRSVFSNFGAKIFMRLGDNETVKEATELAGEKDSWITSIGASNSKDGVTVTETKSLQQRKSLPSEILTQVLSRGEGVVIGSLDGVTNQPVRFVRV